MNPQVSIPKSRLAAFCRDHGIKRLAIFGSALRADFGPESDIDVLVEFEARRTPGLLGDRRHGVGVEPDVRTQSRSSHPGGSEPLFSPINA